MRDALEENFFCLNSRCVGIKVYKQQKYDIDNENKGGDAQ